MTVLGHSSAQGHSRIRVGPLSLHAQTSMHVCKLLCGAEFSVSKTAEHEAGTEETYWVEVDGIGYSRD